MQFYLLAALARSHKTWHGIRTPDDRDGVHALSCLADELRNPLELFGVHLNAQSPGMLRLYTSENIRRARRLPMWLLSSRRYTANSALHPWTCSTVPWHRRMHLSSFEMIRLRFTAIAESALLQDWLQHSPQHWIHGASIIGPMPAFPTQRTTLQQSNSKGIHMVVS